LALSVWIATFVSLVAAVLIGFSRTGHQSSDAQRPFISSLRFTETAAQAKCRSANELEPPYYRKTAEGRFDVTFSQKELEIILDEAALPQCSSLAASRLRAFLERHLFELNASGDLMTGHLRRIIDARGEEVPAFKGWGDGALIELAFTSALELGGLGTLTPSLDELLQQLAHVYEPPADDATAGSAFEWIARYEELAQRGGSLIHERALEKARTLTKKSILPVIWFRKAPKLSGFAKVKISIDKARPANQEKKYASFGCDSVLVFLKAEGLVSSKQTNKLRVLATSPDRSFTKGCEPVALAAQGPPWPSSFICAHLNPQAEYDLVASFGAAESRVKIPPHECDELKTKDLVSCRQEANGYLESAIINPTSCILGVSGWAWTNTRRDITRARITVNQDGMNPVEISTGGVRPDVTDALSCVTGNSGFGTEISPEFGRFLEASLRVDLNIVGDSVAKGNSKELTVPSRCVFSEDPSKLRLSWIMEGSRFSHRKNWAGSLVAAGVAPGFKAGTGVELVWLNKSNGEKRVVFTHVETAKGLKVFYAILPNSISSGPWQIHALIDQFKSSCATASNGLASFQCPGKIQLGSL